MHQVPVLAEHYRVITWDQRGWGKSTDAEGPGGDPNAAVEDLRLLLDHLGVDKAHVIGQSMGGWVVAGFALRYPERTRSLTLANTYGGISTEAMREFMTPELLLERQALGRAAHIADPVRAFQYAQLSRLAPPRAPIDLDAKLRPDLEAACKTTIPILIVTGPHDWIFPPEMMRMLDAELPMSRLVEIPDAGHSPVLRVSGGLEPGGSGTPRRLTAASAPVAGPLRLRPAAWSGRESLDHGLRMGTNGLSSWTSP